MIEIKLLRTRRFRNRGGRPLVPQSGTRSLTPCPQVRLNLCCDGGRGAATKMGFYFETVKNGWIVACSNHDSAREFPAADFKGDVGCGIGPVQHHNAEAIGRDHLCSSARKCFRLKPDV